MPEACVGGVSGSLAIGAPRWSLPPPPSVRRRIKAATSQHGGKRIPMTTTPGTQPAKRNTIGPESENASSGGLGIVCHTRKYFSLPRKSPNHTPRIPTRKIGTRPHHDRLIAASTPETNETRRPVAAREFKAVKRDPP